MMTHLEVEDGDQTQGCVCGDHHQRRNGLLEHLPGEQRERVLRQPDLLVGMAQLDLLRRLQHNFSI